MRRGTMRHGFGSEHFLGYGDGGTTILWILLVISAIVVISILLARSRQKRYPELTRVLNILDDKYADISQDEYMERMMVLEDEDWLDEACREMMRIRERYARCEIDTREYCERREKLRTVMSGASTNS
jgi:uncharacterized membrane protein